MEISTQGRLPEFKIVFVGDAAVGKTSIIMRFHQNRFVQDQQSTIGSAFISKQVEVHRGMVTLNIWDTAGQERYRSLVPMYSRGAAVVILVFDVSQRETFDQLDDWVQKITEDIPNSKILVCGNKCDLPFALGEDEIESWADQHKVKVLFVSAKDGKNVNELFAVAGDMLPAAPFNLAKPSDLESRNEKDEKKCC